MQDVTKDMQARGVQLHAGERIYRLDSGHHFQVYGIKDEVASRHGAEVLRLFATEVTSEGTPVLRRDGKIAEDEHGHTLVRQNHDVIREAVAEDDISAETKVGKQISFRDHVLAETKLYLDRCALASANHEELADLDDLFVDSSKAHRIPDAVKHLRGKVDAYGVTQYD